MNMRIKIIGDNDCARATRHLLRLAGFAVTEFLPEDAVTDGPLAGYAITIELAPAPHTPDAHLRPDHPTHHSHASEKEGPPRSHRDASSPSFAKASAGKPSFGEVLAGKPSFDEVLAGMPSFGEESAGKPSFDEESAGKRSFGDDFAANPDSRGVGADKSAVAPANFRSEGGIHFDSVDSALEEAVLRHVTQLVMAPVILDRPGGVVHSERELRIVAPNTGNATADEAAAVAIEFGVLRGLLDLNAPGAHRNRGKSSAGNKHRKGSAADLSDEDSGISWAMRWWKKWWPFWVLVIAGTVGILRGSSSAVVAREIQGANKTHRLKPAPLFRAGLIGILPEIAEAEAQGQFATGEGFKITDGTNFFVVDPCKAHTKLFASISQTGNTQLVAGTASKKIYVCSIHVVAAVATSVAVVEGTGTVCGTSAAGVGGFGGATAATGWNFAANGGIALGNGDSSLGAEGTSGDNLCIFNSGSGQISGGISYVVQ
jgi:hypothetical protein